MHPKNYFPEKVKALFQYLVLILLMVTFTHASCASAVDVVYLKNGSIYRGVIIHEISGINYTIRLFGGSQVVVSAAEVKEVKRKRSLAPVEYQSDSVRNRYNRVPYRSRYFRYRESGFFAQWQNIVGLIDGMRLTFGYKFNRYAAVGLGSGFEYGNTLADAPYAASNGYFPLFAYLSGDMTKTKFTPFYSFEAGYSFPLNPILYTPSHDGMYFSPPSTYWHHGGLTSGFGVGLKRYSRHLAAFIVSLNLNLGYFNIKSSDFHPYSTPSGGGSAGYYTTYTARYLAIQPSLRFGISFK